MGEKNWLQVPERVGKNIIMGQAMNLLDGVLRAQKVGLARGGGAAAHIDTTGRPVGCHDYGAARAGCGVGPMTEAKRCHVGERDGGERACGHGNSNLRGKGGVRLHGEGADVPYDLGDGKAHHVVEVAVDAAHEHAAAHALDAVGASLVGRFP